eukprot:5598705-Lingulodinium_polyedra.AAC.1
MPVQRIWRPELAKVPVTCDDALCPGDPQPSDAWRVAYRAKEPEKGFHRSGEHVLGIPLQLPPCVCTA